MHIDLIITQGNDTRRYKYIQTSFGFNDSRVLFAASASGQLLQPAERAATNEDRILWGNCHIDDLRTKSSFALIIYAARIHEIAVLLFCMSVDWYIE